jgi:hypothetical protein
VVVVVTTDDDEDQNDGEVNSYPVTRHSD